MESSISSIEDLYNAITHAESTLIARGIPQKIVDIEQKTTSPDIWSNTKTANALFAELKQLKKQWEPISELKKTAADLYELAKESSEEDLELLELEQKTLEEKWKEAEIALYLGGEFDTHNCYLTLSSGAGGTEAQDWTSMLLRMYMRYCENNDWSTSIIEETPGQEAGIKTVTIFIEGAMAYGNLRCEKGTHRLVRQSPFNAKNLRQTSFCLVEALPEITETNEIEIDPNDLRIDTFRSGGAGGQNVNKVESAIRITHIPSGIVVACQTERSQLQNRASAMSMLTAKLLEKKRAEEQASKDALKGATASANFGQQIRSYVLHPYQMVKDLRTDVETSDTTGVLDGNIQEFIDAELKRSALEDN
jgi:peptide chain release factor 2